MAKKRQKRAVKAKSTAKRVTKTAVKRVTKPAVNHAAGKIGTKTAVKRVTKPAVNHASGKSVTKSAANRGKNRFMGANDIYATKRFLAVRKVKSNAEGRIVENKIRYFPKTPRNVRQAESVYGRIKAR